MIQSFIQTTWSQQIKKGVHTDNEENYGGIDKQNRMDIRLDRPLRQNSRPGRQQRLDRRTDRQQKQTIKHTTNTTQLNRQRKNKTDTDVYG